MYVCMYMYTWASPWLSSKRTHLPSRRPGFSPWVGKIPWRRKWQPTPVFLLGKSHGQRSLVDSSSWGHKRVGHDLATKQQQICLPITEPLCYIPEILYTNYT